MCGLSIELNINIANTHVKSRTRVYFCACTFVGVSYLDLNAKHESIKTLVNSSSFYLSRKMISEGNVNNFLENAYTKQRYH